MNVSFRSRLGAWRLLLIGPLVTLLVGQEGGDRPNILFILADDLGWRAPSCYGNKDLATPNIDRLASEGMRFNQSYADAQCSPSRAAFLSGQYGARTGMFEVIFNGIGLPITPPPKAYMHPPAPNLSLSPEIGSLARALRDAGYATGISGKWHVSDAYAAAALSSQLEGKYFDRYGFDFCGTADEAAQKADKAVDAITDDIIGFVEKNRSRPWFAFVSHFAPHTRFNAPPALVEKFARRGFRRTSSPNGRFSERPTAEYLAMLEHLDTSVGRLLKRLDELNLTKRTLVIFTSDNGGQSTATSSLPLREGKGSPYEGGIRVPLLVRWPGVIKPKSECHVPTHIIDFYPTFVELARGAPPRNHHLDGTSLMPLLRGSGTSQRNTLFWHLPTYNIPYGRAPCAVIRQGDWKLVYWFGDYLDTSDLTPDERPYGRLVVGQRVELFNLHDDGGETRNVATQFPAKAAELGRALEKWWQETGAALPKKNPDYDPVDWWWEARDLAKR